MNTKRFTVIDTRTNSTKQWDSQATTLAELKRELSNIGISTSGMAIQEGLTNTELINDTSLLPHDVPYRGTVTNNLVFRLTKAEKNINSGVSREDMYNILNLITDELNKEGENEKSEERKDEGFTAENGGTLATLFKAFNILVNALYADDVIREDTYRSISSLLRGRIVGKVDSPYTADELSDMFANM